MAVAMSRILLNRKGQVVAGGKGKIGMGKMETNRSSDGQQEVATPAASRIWFSFCDFRSLFFTSLFFRRTSVGGLVGAPPRSLLGGRRTIESGTLFIMVWKLWGSSSGST